MSRKLSHENTAVRPSIHTVLLAMTSYNYEFAAALLQRSSLQSTAQGDMPDITIQNHKKLSININIHKMTKGLDT